MDTLTQAEIRMSPAGQTSGTQQSAAPIRVLHVLNQLGTGGTELTTLKVARELQSGFEHYLCVIRSIQEVSKADLRGLAAPVCELRVAGKSALFPLLDAIKTVNPDIVHSRNWGAIEAIAAARLARKLSVHSEHGYELDVLTGMPLRKRLLRSGTYRLANKVFTVTNELRQYHSRNTWFDAERMKVLYNGINTTQFSPSLVDRASVREELGIPGNAFIVGTVGRLAGIKDHATLLAAVERLNEKGEQIHIVIVGDGPELGSLQKKVQDSPSLKAFTVFAGPTSRVARMLSSLDVYVQCSISEGMSNTIVEAMACALPVITTRVGGNPELVSENITGLMFEPRSVAQLAELIARMKNDPGLRSSIGIRARRDVEARFSLEAMVERYRQLYSGLVDGSNE